MYVTGLVTAVAFCTQLSRSFSRTSREYSWRSFSSPHCLHSSHAIVVFPTPGAPCTRTHLAREPSSSQPTSLSSSDRFFFVISSILPWIVASVNLSISDLSTLSFLTTARFIYFAPFLDTYGLFSSTGSVLQAYFDLRYSVYLLTGRSLLLAEGGCFRYHAEI